MKHLILTGATIFVAVLFASAQSIAPSTINATGGSAVLAGNTYEWSVAEMTLINTATASNLVVTQGLLQPNATISSIEENNPLLKSIKVYPAPTENILNIAPSLPEGSTLTYKLVHINGQIITENAAALSAGNELQTIDMSKFANGNYILEVKQTNTKQAYTATYRVVKQ